ncbi:MAG: hypothetical protein JKY61_11915 [Planctomycetes bacterium]|nr:hypothetical protein [Planctomycetota bacterium]
MVPRCQSGKRCGQGQYERKQHAGHYISEMELVHNGPFKEGRTFELDLESSMV